jgi:MFS family permease
LSGNPGPTFVSRRNLFFLIGIGLAAASMSMPMVQIPVYLRELGASVTDIGFFFTVSMLFPIVVRVFGGWLADVVGQLRVILLGSLTGVLTFVVYALAPTWQAALLGPALLAITMALTFPAFYSYVAEHSQEGGRGRAFGIAQFVRNVAWVVAPPLGGLLGQALGYRWMFVAASAGFGLAAIIFFILNRTAPGLSLREQPTLASLRSSLSQLAGLILAGGLISWLLLGDAIRDVGVKLSFDLMPLYLSDIGGISKQGIGLLDGLYGLVLLAVSYPAGWLVDKTNERLGLLLGAGMVALSRLLFPFAPGFLGFAASWGILAIGDGLIEPAGVSLISRAVPANLRGITFGVLVTSLGIFSLPAPWLGSQAWTHLSPRAPFLISAAVVGLVAIPVWFKLQATRRAQEAPTLPTGTRPKPARTATVTVLLAGLRTGPAQATPDLGLPNSREQALLSDAARILREHGALTSGEDGGLICACFGLAPRRAPPQVSALLATHAGLALLDQLGLHNSSWTEAGQQPLTLGVGIATGETHLAPRDLERAIAAGGTVDEWAGWLREPLTQARRLQQLTAALDPGVLLINEHAYRSLAAALSQFTFGPSGPVDFPGGGQPGVAYSVVARSKPLGHGA